MSIMQVTKRETGLPFGDGRSSLIIKFAFYCVGFRVDSSVFVDGWRGVVIICSNDYAKIILPDGF